MNVGVFGEVPLLTGGLKSRLANEEGMAVSRLGLCLCEISDIVGLDAAVLNPHSDNGNGCWDRIKEVIQQYNPGILFYLIDANAERRPFFDRIKLPNLVRVNGDEQKRFFENPAKYIKESYEAYRRTTSPSQTT